MIFFDRLIFVFWNRHPTELQTFSLCDTMKCQMTANLQPNWERDPRAGNCPILMLLKLRDAKANNAFHTCQNVKKAVSRRTEKRSFWVVEFLVFWLNWKSVFIKVCPPLKTSRVLPIQMIFAGNGPTVAHWTIFSNFWKSQFHFLIISCVSPCKSITLD